MSVHELTVEWVANGWTWLTGRRVPVHTCIRCGVISIGAAPELPCPVSCPECGHVHAGPALASICVGCPCEVRPVAS